MTTKKETTDNIFNEVARIIVDDPDDQSYMFETVRDQIERFLKGKYDTVSIHMADALDDNKILITVKKEGVGAKLTIYPVCLWDNEENPIVKVLIPNAHSENPFIFDMSKKTRITAMLAKIEARLNSGIKICKAHRKNEA